MREAFCTYEVLVGPLVDKEVPRKLLSHLEQPGLRINYLTDPDLCHCF